MMSDIEEESEDEQEAEEEEEENDNENESDGSMVFLNHEASPKITAISPKLLTYSPKALPSTISPKLQPQSISGEQLSLELSPPYSRTNSVRFALDVKDIALDVPSDDADGYLTEHELVPQYSLQDDDFKIEDFFNGLEVNQMNNLLLSPLEDAQVLFNYCVSMYLGQIK